MQLASVAPSSIASKEAKLSDLQQPVLENPMKKPKMKRLDAVRLLQAHKAEVSFAQVNNNSLMGLLGFRCCLEPNYGGTAGIGVCTE